MDRRPVAAWPQCAVRWNRRPGTGDRCAIGINYDIKYQEYVELVYISVHNSHVSHDMS